MSKRIASPQFATYRYPALCARCGSPDATTTGQITKSTRNRFIRFVWEKVETFTLTVPACEGCKALLDKHTYAASLVSLLSFLLGAGAVLFVAYSWLEWFYLILAAWWGGALISNLLARLYRRLFHHPYGVTWPDLCTYEDNVLTFKQPVFQRQFLQLNVE